MPMLFLIIMSLALPTSDSKHGLTLTVYDEANNNHSEFLIDILKQSEKVKIGSVKISSPNKLDRERCTSNNNDDDYCIVILKSLADYIKNSSSELGHLEVITLNWAQIIYLV